MGLNIKNEAVIANVRKLSEAKGVSMTQAVDEAVRDALAVVEHRSTMTRTERLRRLGEIQTRIQSNIRPLDQGELGSDTSEFYDEWGMPK